MSLARDAARPHEDYFYLGEMLKDLIGQGVPVKVCGTYKSRCGLYKGQPYFDGVHEATMAELAQWVKEAENILSF